MTTSEASLLSFLQHLKGLDRNLGKLITSPIIKGVEDIVNILLILLSLVYSAFCHAGVGDWYICNLNTVVTVDQDGNITDHDKSIFERVRVSFEWASDKQILWKDGNSKTQRLKLDEVLTMPSKNHWVMDDPKKMARIMFHQGTLLATGTDIWSKQNDGSAHIISMIYKCEKR